MVQLNILSGPKAGGSQVVRRFPFHVGRAADNDLCLDAPGIWDHHFVLNLRRKEGIVLETVDQAFAAVNDETQTSVRLRNGDFISFGSIKVRFWLAAPRQRGLLLRESSAWAILILITIGQGALIAWLLSLG
jgi:hypothetical protein